MKQLICLACLGAILCLQSCGGGLIKNNDSGQTSSTGVKSKVPIPTATDNLVVGDEKDLTGYWVGQFGPDVAAGDSVDTDEGDGGNQYNTINISIDSLNGADVKGHTVIAGKVRFFKCSMKTTAAKYQFTFKGGADEKAAGTYKFSITKGDSLLKGRWAAASDTIQAHGFALIKRHFTYNPGWKLTTEPYVDYGKRKTVAEKVDGETYNNDKFFSTSDDVIKYNASADILTKQYVANLKKADLIVLRNSIFARHGYTFKKPVLSLFFSDQPWYVPLNTDVTAQLTPIEKKNIALMAPYEKNAEEYYGVFGR